MNRAQKDAYKRDYAAAKADGKPFFPYAVYKDLVVATVAIGIVIALALWVPVEVGTKVDPTTTTYVPRPEWYFLFLFQLLRIFKNQDVLRPVIMATFIIPNILMGLLLLWPFLDRGPERRIWKRPFSIVTAIAVIWFLGYMTYKGATAPEGAGNIQKLPITIPAGDKAALAGETLVLANGCLNCHTIAGTGGAIGPNLTNEGAKNRGIQFQIDHLKNPRSTSPGSIMPSFAGLTPQQLQDLATLLEGLGTKYK